MALFLAGCGSTKAPPLVPDYGPEEGGKEDSATRPAVTGEIAYGATVEVAMGDGGINWRAFTFVGAKGQIVDAHAQGLDNTDTVLYLYKISRITGRPYGKPVGYNDDTEQDGWSLKKGAAFNPLSSSIIGAVLPEDRTYALVLTTYGQAGGRALVKVEPKGSAFPSTIPPFDGTGRGTLMHFVEGTQPVIDGSMYPVSAQLQTAIRGANSSLVASAAVYQFDPDELAALLADPAKKGDLAYGLLLGDVNTNSFDASWTPVTSGNAVAELMQAAAPDGDSGLQALVTFVLKSMLHDSDFRASDVELYRLHWDNADDTNAEGIAAVKTTTGEVRVFSLDNPP
jgi:hypothetical protein